MGKYINTKPDGERLYPIFKVDQLISCGAEIIDQPFKWEEDIVCVVENGHFDAAAYIFDEQELQSFAYPCGRRKTWLKLKDAKTMAF